MSFPLTPTHIAAVYTFLRSFPPFGKLPPSDQVIFRVIKTSTKYADYCPLPTHTLRVSRATNGHLSTVAQAVAHEMIHMLLKVRGSASWSTHGKEFLAVGRRVCKTFGWDAKSFT